MKKVFILSLLIVGLISLQNASATNFGANITIYDKNSSGSGWFGPQEDQEVEPNCVAGQIWDLEAFFLKGLKLTAVGGFDFKNGVAGWEIGDLFVDTNGDALYGPANTGSGGDESYPLIVNKTFNYEYAFNFNFTTMTYNVFALNSASTLRIFYNQNDESNPWRYNSGGIQIGSNIGFSYSTGLSNDAVGGLLGNTHNALTVDLSIIPLSAFGSISKFHLTQECGNDNLMGAAAIPEPGTLLMLGSGMLGLGFMGWCRKRRSSGEK